ncbi:glutamate-rich protein 3-like isoform X5 [Lineus longissimus]|uniref:glutamate-rich protein 3-like isoform X5 n=1 Tax=Lineus longissimus TaxID=88925 RepID=UPI00315C5673
MSHIDAGPLSTYNSLMDKHLAGYFSNSKMRRHLKKSGLITRRGEIVTQNQYRHNMAKKEHKQHVKDLLAQAIVHKTLDMERMRQVAIKKKLEEIAKIELVRRVKTDRRRQGDEDILPYLSPRPNSASQRPKTSPARGRPKDPYSRPDARLGFQEHPDYYYSYVHDDDDDDETPKPSSSRRPIYIDAEGQPISPRDEKYPKEEIDTRHLYGLDNVALREYTMTLDESKKGKAGASPYVQSQLPDDAKIPSPPRTSRSVQSAGSKRRLLRPMKQRGTLHRQEPPMTHPSRLQSLCEVTIRYHGENLQLAHEVLGDPRHEVLVEQQHCGGNTLIVYKDLLMPGTDFQFLSRRHRGYPFSLTFYVNGVMSARLSTCCEFKHTAGCKIGGKQGHFGLVAVSGGLGPCYKCQVEKQVKESQKKKKQPKPAKEEKAEPEENEEEEDTIICPVEDDEDYEDDFDDDDDDDKSSKKDKDDEKDGGAGGASGHSGDSSSDAGDDESVQEEPEDDGKKGGDEKGKASGGEHDQDEGVLSSDTEVDEKSGKVVVAADVHASDDEKVESVAESETEEKKDVAVVVTSAPESPRESMTSPKEGVTSPRESVTSPRDSSPTSSPESAVSSPREASPVLESPPAKEPEPETADETGAESDISDTEGDDADAEPDYSSTSDTESRTGTGSESDVGAYLALKSTTPTLEPVIEHPGSISTIIDNKPHVDLSSIQLNKTQVKELCEDVAERDDIQSVVVRNGKLDDKSIGKLTESILATPSEVKMLNFNLNRITPEGAKHVSTIVKERPKIQVLLLHGNPLGDDGVKEVVDAVEYLKIAAEPKPLSPVSDVGSQESTRSVESEEGTPIRSAAKDLVKGVMDDVMRSPSFQELQPGQKFELLQIDLGDTTMGNAGASHVARMIAFDTPISTLNLTGNMNIKRAGWQSISEALKHNTHLRVLTLDYTMLGDEGVEILAEALKQNTTLRTIDLEGNFISDKGGDAILDLLSVNKSIQDVTVMPGNKLSEEKQSQIKDALDARKSS